jgi:hypothetical protein
MSDYDASRAMSHHASSSVCSWLFEHAARHDDRRWPGFVWDAPAGIDVEFNRALGRSLAVQNIVSCGTCEQLATHAQWLVEIAGEVALASGRFDELDHRAQAAALAELFRSFYSCDPSGGPALFCVHGWCLPDRPEAFRRGMLLRDVPGTGARMPADGSLLRLKFDPGGYRSLALECRSLRWTAGPEFDASELRPAGMSLDCRVSRDDLSVNAVHYEHVVLAPPGSAFLPMLRDGLFPYQRGTTFELGNDATVVQDFPVINAVRLRPLRVEAGRIVRAVRDCLTVLIDARSGAVARISASHSLFDEPSDGEAEKLWRHLKGPGTSVQC